MRHYKFNTPSEAYLALLADVLYNPEYICSPRGQKTYEVTNYGFEILEPNCDPIITLDEARNAVIADYGTREKTTYRSMTRSTEDFSKLSKFWAKLDNGDGTINSSYYYLLKGVADHGDPVLEAIRSNSVGVYRSTWDWAKLCLTNDKDTRQAIMRISRPEHQWKGCLDQPCTMHLNWYIREDKLHLSTVMRSNDLFRGTVWDLSFFMSLMPEMLEELKSTYPKLQIGSYSHFAHSLHIYDSNVKAILKMIGST